MINQAIVGGIAAVKGAKAANRIRKQVQRGYNVGQKREMASKLNEGQKTAAQFKQAERNLAMQKRAIDKQFAKPKPKPNPAAKKPVTKANTVQKSQKTKPTAMRKK